MDTIKDVEQVFTEIYKDKKWGINFANMGSSGPGSDLSNVREYMEFLQVFINLNKIQSIMDVGCGDFQFMRHMDLRKVKYTGVDCVKSVVKFNNKEFGSDNISFKYKDLSRHTFDYADLYILKDVLQHLSNEMIYNFLDYITESKLAKYIIITNCMDQVEEDQDVPSIGETRFLDGKMFPLKKYNPIILKEYNSKQVCVIKL